MEPKFGFVDEKNFPLFTDLYELTMMQGYFKNNKTDYATFDFFFRKLPKNRGYLLVAGLEQLCYYLKNLKFRKEHVEFLASKGFDDDFLDWLKRFKFQGTVYAMPEGTLTFPNEPVVRITAPLIEAQLLETFVINTMMFQTMVATKASRMWLVAKGKPLIDFGSRRAHGVDAGIKAARASYIGGFDGTSNVLAGKLFGIPIFGTMAHSWIQSYEDELLAFREYVKVYGEKSILLIDTYDTLQGARHAAEVSLELKRKVGKHIRGIRLDSGDVAKLSKKVRKVLDSKGLKDVKIFVSSGLDEYKIKEILSKKSPVDGFGVGTKLVTSKDAPAIEGVYKLVEVGKKDRMRPIMKLSEGKITLPGRKQVWRIERRGKYVKDVIGLDGEKVEGRKLLVKVFEEGKLVYRFQKLEEIREKALKELERLPERYKRIIRPSAYPVILSKKLRNLVRKLSKEIEKKEMSI